MATLVLCFVIACTQSRVHDFLVIVVIGESGVNLGGGQVRIVHHDLRCAVAMGDVIRNNIDHPVSGSVYAGPTPSIEGDMGIDYIFRLAGSHGALLPGSLRRKVARKDREEKASLQEDAMGEITVSVTLENPIDRGVFERGYGEESAIRRSSLDAIVDTGAVMLVLPQNVVERLGLEIRRQAGRRLAGPLTIHIGNRFMSTDCIVGPPLSEPLIGQIVFEALDLIADCTNRTLTPRPESPDYPLLKLK